MIEELAFLGIRRNNKESVRLKGEAKDALKNSRMASSIIWQIVFDLGFFTVAESVRRFCAR
tara:strand:- start:5 stop:187 length:183 start_codon:yes stop_codon:yes gene_type:complete